MQGKQHTGFKYRLLGMLFLFFNVVCTATPVIKATSDEYHQVVSLRLMQNAHAGESEEENFVTTSYVNQLAHFSFKRITHHLLRNNNNQYAEVLPDRSWTSTFITVANLLPKPAYYTFLFRYQLF